MVHIIETKTAIVATPHPHFEKAKGIDRVPPPTQVFKTLKIPTTTEETRSGESKDGEKWSGRSDILECLCLLEVGIAPYPADSAMLAAGATQRDGVCGGRIFVFFRSVF